MISKLVLTSKVLVNHNYLELQKELAVLKHIYANDKFAWQLDWTMSAIQKQQINCECEYCHKISFSRDHEQKKDGPGVIDCKVIKYVNVKCVEFKLPQISDEELQQSYNCDCSRSILYGWCMNDKTSICKKCIKGN